MIAYFVVATILARRLGARPLPLLAATVLVAFLALPMVSPRATIVVEALLLTTVLLAQVVSRASLTHGPRMLAVVVSAGAALGWVGSWIHVSWPVTAAGLAVALPGLALLGGAERRRQWVFVAGSIALLAGSCLGPYGMSVWRLMADVSSASDGQIIEWLSPFTPGLRLRWLPVALLCLGLSGGCAARLGRSARGPSSQGVRSRWALSAVLAGISLLAAVAGLFAIRFLGVCALTLLPVLGRELSTMTVRWRARAGKYPRLKARLSAAYWRPVLTGALAVLLPLAVFTARDPGRPTAESEITGALPRACHLFADPSVAGAVLLLRPDVEVWIDMRTEVHGSRAYADTRRRLSDLRAVPLPHGTTCALLPTGVTSAHLDGDPDVAWRRLTATARLSLWVPA